MTGSTTATSGAIEWPDRDNTILAFRYDREGRVFPNLNYSDDINAKIEATWQLVGLNRHIDTSNAGFIKATNKDARWRHRREEWQQAERNKLRLVRVNTPEVIELIIERALAKGFFSIWYTVFYDNPIVRRKLVEAFKGTDASCFNDDYLPVHRPDGLI